MSTAIGWEQLSVAAHQKTKERDYWLHQLAGSFTRGEFPADDLARSTQGSADATYEFECPEPLHAALLKVSNGSEARLLMILISGVMGVLAKYSGARDLVVGTSILRQEVAGDYLNTVLPLRASLPPQPTFKDLLTQVRHALTEAVEHQSYPMAVLAEQLQLSAAGGHSPFFDAAVLLENLQDERYLESADPSLTFLFHSISGQMTGRVTYDAHRYSQATVERYVSHLLQLLTSALARPDEPLDRLDILSEGEKRLLLETFNPHNDAYAATLPRQATVQELFEAQAARTPDAVAVVHSDTVLTYRELNERANQLAHALIRHGAGPNRIVALLAERDERMVVSILAVLKAGAAYLPLDPEFPAERASYMLADSEAVLLLGDATLVADWNVPCPVLDLAAALAETPTSRDNVPLRSGPTDLAYSIYTSGSTGKPKGVLVEHRNVVSLVYALHERVYRQHPPQQKVATVAPFVFDATVQMMFPALLLGHALYVVPSDVRIDGGQLLRFYRDEQIDLTDGTPSHLRLMLESAGEGPLTGLALKRLMIGGEALPGDVARTFLQKFTAHPPVITNSYGPSECCVQSSAYDLTAADLTDGAAIPIGKPLAGERILILDEAANLLPIGVPGELCIGGDGVTRGYLNRPELTQERFIQDPYHPGETLYRTGDLARFRADGNIEYLGRIDQQVKIRGYRIELPEIEHALRDHAEACGFTDAVVIDRADTSGERYLCAYLVSAHEIDAGDLKARLALTLPSYMVPPFIVRIDKLPMNVSGKLDRNALPDPRSLLTAVADYVAPRNEIESRLVAIWSEILEIESSKIGVYDTFFDLGGTSFKVLQLSNRLHEEFLREIPVVQMFRFTTIHALAEHLALPADETTRDQSLDEAERSADDALDLMEDNLHMFEVADDE